MASPRFAIVIPAYNPGAYLGEAVNSVIAQTLPDWEAVIVDDGSEEDLTPLEALDARITLLRQENAGPSVARNTGIAATSAGLVAFLDADDYWAPDKLEQQLNEFAAHPESILCTTDFEIVDSEGARMGPGYRGFRDGYLDLLGGCGICISTVMVRRSALESEGGFDRSYFQCEDWDLWLRLARTGPFARVEAVLASYRIHGGNSSVNYMRLLDEGTRLLRAHAGHGNGDVQQAAEAGIARLRQLVGAQAYDDLRRTHDPRALLRALWLNPGYTLRALTRYALRRR